MGSEKICSTCGKALGANAPGGLCPECLIKVGLGSGVDLAADTNTGATRRDFVPPPVEKLGPLFPQLEILELIGKGGMGAVYEARQRELDRIVALKILPPDVGQDAAFAERFTREARALAKLNHPGIVTLYEFGRANGLYFFLMEYVDGVNLRQLLAGGRVSAREALAIVPQICDALQYAHDQGIVHRDIKPENILLDRRGRVKVADFGLAKIIGNQNEEKPSGGESAPASSALSDASKVMGTPQYMSPEQISAPGEVDHRADIYALGVVFYQMLTGELPGKKIERPSSKVQIDVRLDEVVLRALEKNPELRYQQVSEVKTVVETIAATPSRAETGDAPVKATRPRVRLEIAGASLAPIFFIVALLWFLNYVAYSTTADHGGQPQPLGMVAAMGTPFALLAAAATTILGWFAVSQIRRSAGPPRGLGLAVFDGLLFPLLAIDGLIGLVALFLAGMLLGLLHSDHMEVNQTYMIVALGLLFVALMVWLDFLIARAVWRAANKNAAPQVPSVGKTAAADSQQLEKSGKTDERSRRFGKLALALCLGGLVLGVVINLLPSPAERPAIAVAWIYYMPLLCEIAAIVLGIIGWKSRAGKAVVIITVLLVLMESLTFFSLLFRTRQPHLSFKTSGADSVPEIESVEINTDKAVVKQRSFHGEGMELTFGPVTNRWEPNSAYFDHLFEVTVQGHFLGQGADWVIKSRHGTYSDYILDGPPGPMHGKIVFHPGTPGPEVDGSYVIGEFRPETGPPLPITVLLEKSVRRSDKSHPTNLTPTEAAIGMDHASTKPELMAWVEDFFAHNYRDITKRDTLEWGEVNTSVDGNLSIRYEYRATIWDKDIVTNNQVFTFDSHGKFVSVKVAYANPKERMMALVETFFANNFRDITSRETLDWGDVRTTADGNTSIHYQYRAKILGKETVTNNQVFTFDAQDKFVSVKDVKSQ